MKRRFFLCLIFGGFILFPLNSFSGTDSDKEMKKTEEKKVEVENFDLFDSWVEQAVTRGILKPEIEFDKPSKIELVLRKIALPFLSLYICSVHKFRAFKVWTYALLFGKQKQQETSIE